MGKRGPAPKLRVVEEREGRPGHRPLIDGLRLPPGAPAEPDWGMWFPAIRVGRRPAKPAVERPRKPRKDASELDRAACAQVLLAWQLEQLAWGAEVRAWADRRHQHEENVRARAFARSEWVFLVRWLDSVGIVSEIDGGELVDVVLTRARRLQAERDISFRGITVLEPDGSRKRNESVTTANQYRDKLRPLVGAFGLTPLARDQLNPREGGSEDGDWT